jgi:peptide/nickel transport system permease protein
VVEDLIDFFPASIELTLFALVFATLIAVPLGVTAAKQPNSRMDNGLRMVSSFFISMPDFWLGLLLILFFFGMLGWFPFTGQLSFSTIPPPQVTGFMTIDSLIAGDFSAFADALWHLVLPAVTLSFISIGFFSRMTRAAMIDVLRSKYIRTAYGKGVPPRRILYVHALKNALVPIIVIMGIQLGNIVGGAVVVETIFSWPGIGKYAVEAVQNGDFPAIMGFALTYSLFYATVNFAVDLASLAIDPRLRRSFSA